MINNLPFINTTLSLYELSDVYPAKLHMTVQTDFRRNSDIPGILVLHYADVPEGDVQTAQGFKFTRHLRTILDLLEAGTVEQAFIRRTQAGYRPRPDHSQANSERTNERTGAQDR